jgi:hypothetical protein
MPSVPKSLPWSNAGAPDLLSQAAAVLAREALRLPGALAAEPSQAGTFAAPALPDAAAGIATLGGLTCPVVGAKLPLPGAEKADLRQQAHELLAGLFSAFGQTGGAPGTCPDPSQAVAAPWQKFQTPKERACPVTKASVPIGGFDKDALRRKAHEFIDTLLVTFREATDEDGVVAENKVPLIQCPSPTQAGNVAHATLKVANEEATPSEVTLYCTNFVADSGYEIPALRVSISPRVASIPGNGQVTFEIKISVPQQAPAGTYSALLQALGSKYVKAVLSLQVL